MSKNSYHKKDNITFSIGVYPTLELLKYRPNQVKEVYISSKSQSNKGVVKISNICRERRIGISTNDRILGDMSRNDNSYAVGVAFKYNSKIDVTKNHLLLINPSDMGNLGTIIRTAHAFDILDIAVIKPAADIFHPKVIRSSMGSLFALNFQYFEELSEYVDITKSSKRSYYGLDKKGTTTINDVKIEKPYTLVFGSEENGIDNNTIKILNGIKMIRIPQSNNVDSLNLAVAAGIVMQKFTTSKS